VLGEEGKLATGPLCVDQLATEFHSLKANLGRLGRNEAAPPAWDAIAEPINARLAELTQEIVRARAGNGRELAMKASILLDWIDPHGADLPFLLCASLCRDIVLLFPAGRAD
jgi:hypothetical protein